ncbi:MAG: spondin domain-containing protein [Pseudomonadales bacterium]|nr:spondin domain-containing protein [Pseudomonadales bacterium]
MKPMIKKSLVSVLALGLLVLVSGCDNDNDNGAGRYEISVTNLSNNQPMSPPAWAFHDEDYMGWEIGSAATAGLEILAESGDASSFVSEARNHAAVYTQRAADEMVLPGQTQTYTVAFRHDGGLQFTLATMLVNTNDAFVGVSGVKISDLATGEERTYMARAYDAGTEENLETAATIPGPAGGGEGFNAAREASDKVSMHSGVVTNSDGLSSSALDQSHRFDNPVARVVIRHL